MRVPLTRLALFAVLTSCLAVSAGRAAHVSGEQPIFTHFPTRMLCTDGPFVALVSVQPLQLVVVRIGSSGIEEPHKLPLRYNDVYGMKCTYQRVELLVQGAASDHFSRLPFTIGSDTVQQEQPKDIDYSVSGKGPTPPAVDDFHTIPTLLKRTRGDWYVGIFGVPDRHSFELHFVKTENRARNGLTTRFSVDLLEETPNRKIISSVPLIRETNFEAAD